MYKRIISLLLITFLIFSVSINTYAHDRTEHDEDLEYVLFGDKDYKKTHPIYTEKIQAIEDAAYLCIDQFNGNGKEELKYLQTQKIPDIPKSIDEFDFNSNYAHRKFTHRGWNVNYDAKANWPVRKKILLNTVNKVAFESVVQTPLSWLPVIGEKLRLRDSKEYSQQCESFCILVYYVHILGDHLEADSYKKLAYVDPLTELNDRDNPGIIPDLIECCGLLFESQTQSETYNLFIQELNELQDISDDLRSSSGGVDSEEEFIEYHNCAERLRETLATYIPRLLKNEEFFISTFS